MEDQKCPMQRPVSTAVLCVAVVLKQLRGTPELFSIWCQQHEGGRDHDMGGCLANGTLRRLGLCHSVPARCIQSPPYCRNPAPRQSICGWPPPTPAVMAQATGAVRVLRHPSHRLPPPAPTRAHTNTHIALSHCPCNSCRDLALPLESPAGTLCSCIPSTRTEA